LFATETNSEVKRMIERAKASNVND